MRGRLIPHSPLLLRGALLESLGMKLVWFMLILPPPPPPHPPTLQNILYETIIILTIIIKSPYQISGEVEHCTALVLPQKLEQLMEKQQQTSS